MTAAYGSYFGTPVTLLAGAASLAASRNVQRASLLRKVVWWTPGAVCHIFSTALQPLAAIIHGIMALWAKLGYYHQKSQRAYWERQTQEQLRFAVFALYSLPHHLFSIFNSATIRDWMGSLESRKSYLPQWIYIPQTMNPPKPEPN
jgi:uncharacterized membrane protein